MDCQHLVTIGSKEKIAEVLSDLKLCDSSADYREILQFSEQYALQQAKAIEAEIKNQFGMLEADRIMMQAKQQYMFAS